MFTFMNRSLKEINMLCLTCQLCLCLIGAFLIHSFFSTFMMFYNMKMHYINVIYNYHHQYNIISIIVVVIIFYYRNASRKGLLCPTSLIYKYLTEMYYILNTFSFGIIRQPSRFGGTLVERD